MTVRNFEATDVRNITVVKENMETPRGVEFIDHVIEFIDGSVVAYGDPNREGFVWVMEAAR